MHITHGHQILLGFMLNHCGDEVIDFSSISKEHLALAILHILLYVKRDGLGYAEILHVLRNSDAKLFCQIEKMVDGMTRSKNDSSVVKYINFLRAEIFGGDAFYLNKRTEHKFNVESRCDVVVRRLFA